MRRLTGLQSRRAAAGSTREARHAGASDAATAASIPADAAPTKLNASPAETPNRRLESAGVKSPAAAVPASVLSVGTDDENYGGVWRPLFRPVGGP